MQPQPAAPWSQRLRGLVRYGPSAIALALVSPASGAAARYLPGRRLRARAQTLSARAYAQQETASGWLAVNLKWVILVLTAVSVLFLVVFSIKSLAEFYGWLWVRTTGEPWTYIMRRNGYLLIVPSVLIFSNYIFWTQATADDVAGIPEPVKPALRAKVIIRLIGLLIVAFGIGFVYGHVFWGGSCVDVTATGC